MMRSAMAFCFFAFLSSADVLAADLKQHLMTVTLGKKVTIADFGSFKPAARAARVGKNPKTGAPIKIPATTVPKFTPGVAFRDLVAKEGKRAK